jgi:hypothetical protein
VSAALASLEGKALESVRVQVTAPGAFLLTIAVDGLDLSVRLDRSGARLTSVGM